MAALPEIMPILVVFPKMRQDTLLMIEEHICKSITPPLSEMSSCSDVKVLRNSIKYTLSFRTVICD